MSTHRLSARERKKRPRMRRQQDHLLEEPSRGTSAPRVIALTAAAIVCLAALVQSQAVGQDSANRPAPVSPEVTGNTSQNGSKAHTWTDALPTAFAMLFGTIAASALIGYLVWRQQRRALRQVTREERRRRVITPFLMIQRIAVPLVAFAGGLIILMQFPAFRRLGTTFLASAGVVGIVVGLAARSTLANAVAGIMICFSQPVRIGDTIMIGTEYGVVEEIGLMYTVFKTWDNRRVMIPNEVMANKEIVNYSIRDEKIWTKVPVHLDYSADVDKARAILVDVVKHSEHWDGTSEPAVWTMELGEENLTLWVAAWTNSPTDAWGLKCEVLENALKRFRQEDIPLPRRRYQRENPSPITEEQRAPSQEN